MLKESEWRRRGGGASGGSLQQQAVERRWRHAREGALERRTGGTCTARWAVAHWRLQRLAQGAFRPPPQGAGCLGVRLLGGGRDGWAND